MKVFSPIDLDNNKSDPEYMLVMLLNNLNSLFEQAHLLSAGNVENVGNVPKDSIHISIPRNSELSLSIADKREAIISAYKDAGWRDVNIIFNNFNTTISLGREEKLLIKNTLISRLSKDVLDGSYIITPEELQIMGKELLTTYTTVVGELEELEIPYRTHKRIANHLKQIYLLATMLSDGGHIVPELTDYSQLVEKV